MTTTAQQEAAATRAVFRRELAVAPVTARPGRERMFRLAYVLASFLEDSQAGS